MTTFSDFGLKPNLTKALIDLGFTTPTPIQEKTIPQLLTSQQDLKAFAQTGTGKTAAFSLPIIEQIDTNNKNTVAIILSPTRELATQTAKNIKEFTKYLPKVKTVAVYGGANIEDQIRTIKKGVHIVVGTPGRTVDLIKRRILNLNTIKWVVLDEADEMLNMGFKEELDTILEVTPNDKQTLLFSATFPKEVNNIAKNYMHNAIEIAVGGKNTGAVNVTHEAYITEEKNRYLALKRIADFFPDIYGIVFCRTRSETKTIADKLIADGYNADALHGDLSQAQRDMVMQKFRSKHLQILVATDVAARGIDIEDLTHVINYKLPDQIEIYTHRSGRTGRAGKLGVSIALINGREQHKLRPIEKMVAKKFEIKTIPSSHDICRKQLFKLINKVKEVDINEGEINPFLKDIYAELESFDRETLIKSFVSVEFNRFLAYYKNAQDINGDNSRSKSRKTPDNFTRFHINLGKMDDLNPKDLIGLLNKYLNKHHFDIGQIEILKSFSFFEVEKTVESVILGNLNEQIFNGRAIKVEVTNSPKNRSRNFSRDSRNRGGRDNRNDKSTYNDGGRFKSKKSNGGRKGFKRRG